MKGFKKVIAVTLAAAMTLGMAACGSKEPTGSAAGSDTGGVVEDSTPIEGSNDSNDNAEVEDSVETDDLGQYTVLTDENGDVYDLGGMEIVIGDWWSPDEYEEPTNAFEEAREEYLDWIQETYNFTIKNIAISNWNDMPEDFVNFATTGGEENYVFALRQGKELIAAMGSGLMYDLSTLDCLDFSEAKWGSGVHELTEKQGAIYGMRGIESEVTSALYFNKRLLEEAGIDPNELYDLQESGDWTWAKFEEICQKIHADTNNDGVIDRFAMTSFGSTFYPAAVASNGGHFINKDTNGFYSTLESDETMEALNWALDMISNYEMIYPEDAEWDYTFTAFANGEAAFSAAGVYEAGNWKDMEDDFGLVCFPKGPRMDDYTNVYNDNVYVIPACYDEDRAWKLAFAYNLYTDPIPGFEDYAGWKTEYYKNFRDTEAVDLTITRMSTNGMVTFHNMVPGVDMGPDFLWGISKDSTPAQQAEAIRNTWASYIEEANK